MWNIKCQSGGNVIQCPLNPSLVVLSQTYKLIIGIFIGHFQTLLAFSPAFSTVLILKTNKIYNRLFCFQQQIPLNRCSRIWWFNWRMPWLRCDTVTHDTWHMTHTMCGNLCPESRCITALPSNLAWPMSPPLVPAERVTVTSGQHPRSGHRVIRENGTHAITANRRGGARPINLIWREPPTATMCPSCQGWQ